MTPPDRGPIISGVGFAGHEDVWARRERERAAARVRLLEEVRARIPRAAEVLREAGCSEAWLVGSFARGDPDDRSDVDLVARGLQPRRRGDVWWTLCKVLGREVDLAEVERIDPGRLQLLLDQAVRLLP